MQQWHDQTPPDFVFDIKLHQLLSRHRAEAKFLPPDLRRELPLAGDVVKLTSQSEKLVLQRMLRELAPIVTSKKFGAFLLQLSPAFSPREHILAELDHLFALLSGYRVAVELRNRAWMNDEQALSTVEFFRERRATLVTVDAPETEHFTVMPRTHVVSNSSLAYYRLHGRDAQAFVRGRTVADRFNYQYSGEELEEIARHIITWSRDVQEFHAVFNNNRSDFAPAAARKLLQLLAAFRSTNVRVRQRRVPQQLSFDGEQGGLTAETSEL